MQLRLFLKMKIMRTLINEIIKTGNSEYNIYCSGSGSIILYNPFFIMVIILLNHLAMDQILYQKTFVIFYCVMDDVICAKL